MLGGQVDFLMNQFWKHLGVGSDWVEGGKTGWRTRVTTWCRIRLPKIGSSTRYCSRLNSAEKGEREKGPFHLYKVLGRCRFQTGSRFWATRCSDRRTRCRNHSHPSSRGKCLKIRIFWRIPQFDHIHDQTVVNLWENVSLMTMEDDDLAELLAQNLCVDISDRVNQWVSICVATNILAALDIPLRQLQSNILTSGPLVDARPLSLCNNQSHRNTIDY